MELCFLKTTSGLKISLPVLNDGYSECRKYLDNPKYFAMAPYPHLIGTWSYTLLPGFMLLTKSRTVHASIRPTVFLFCLFRIRNFFFSGDHEKYYENIFSLRASQSNLEFLVLSDWQALRRARRFILKYSRTSSILTPKGQSQVSVLERCPYKRGHYDDVTFVTPLTVLTVQ